MQVEQEFRGRAADERRSYDVGEPVSIVADSAEPVQQRERVEWRRDVPSIAVVLAHAGCQREHRGDVARDERLPAVKERVVVMMVLIRAETAEARLEREHEKGSEPGTFARGDRIFACRESRS